MTNLLPAMGYSDRQRHELEETIQRVPCDLVLIATPIDLARIVRIQQPALRVSYEVEDRSALKLRDVLADFTAAHKPRAAAAGAAK
jgi:predicted GTPase